MGGGSMGGESIGGASTGGGSVTGSADARLVRPFGPLVRLASRGVLGRRRTLLMALIAAVPVLVALIWLLTGQPDRPALFASTVLDPWVLTTVLPIIALVLGTSVLGSEIEDGTIVYLLSKPLPRWLIVAAAVAVAGLASAALVVASTALCWVAGLGSAAVTPDAARILAGVAFGAVVYSFVAVALSSLTGRALIIGLLYVMLWEGSLASLLAGTRLLSVRQYVLAIAGISSDIDRPLGPAGSTVDAPTAILLGLLVIVASFAIAVVRLRGFQVTERT